MALRELGDPDDAAARRNRLLRLSEGRMQDASAAALRQFLRRVLEHTGPESLTAATAGDFPRSLRLFTIGEASGWWEAAVNEHVRSQVSAVWRAGYFDTRDGDLISSSGEQLGDYLANVTDRLSRTATPTIPEQAFDTARSALADEVARGSDLTTMSRRLAQEFSWDADATLDRERLTQVNGQIDRVLDAIGPPGDPKREAMRLADPEIARMQAERAEYVKRIDRVESTWQTRAERISRTETTGAYNAGALDAGHVEGQAVKVWMTTGDERTRDEHLAAGGQCVPIGDRFTVGGDRLEMPGDPSGSAGMIINCRCTVVFADSCEDAAQRFGPSQEVVDAQRRERGLEVDEDPPEPNVVADDPPELPLSFANGDEAAVWLDQQAQGLELSDQEVNSLTFYRGSGYDRINQGLREGEGFPQGTVDAIDGAIAKSVINEPVVAYRGVGPEFTQRFGSDLSGLDFTDRGYLSTSLNPETAEVFGRGGALLKIEVPAGTRALPMDAVGGLRESELLVARGQRIQVVADSGDRSPQGIPIFVAKVVRDD